MPWCGVFPKVSFGKFLLKSSEKFILSLETFVWCECPCRNSMSHERYKLKTSPKPGCENGAKAQEVKGDQDEDDGNSRETSDCSKRQDGFQKECFNSLYRGLELD